MKNGMIKRVVFLMVSCYMLTVNCFGLDFHFRPKGFVSIPMGDGNVAVNGNDLYSLGGGGELGLEIDLATVWPNPLGLGYTLGVEGGVVINSLQSEPPENVTFYSAGGTIGLYFFPLSRLLIRADSAVGVYMSAGERGTSDPGLYWRGGGELGFRFTPSFTLAANAGWRQYMQGYNLSGDLFNSGAYAGLTAQITLQTGSGAGQGVNVLLDQSEPVYPAFMQLYQNYPIANIILRNNENAEIRDVRVSFRAGNYTSSEYSCGNVGIIPRGRKVELPLLADFSPDIMLFTDTGRIMGEIVIRYRFLGQEREVVGAVTVATYNRNTVPLGDANAFASFIFPTSAEVLNFARFIAGLERSNRRSGVNTNYQYAVWLLEGLRASGIRVGSTRSSEEEALYPAETLAFRTGTNRDLALLFAACLEATGKRSAIIQTENDFLVAVSLGTVQQAGALANDRNRILIVNDEVWLPLSMTAYVNGFSAAWNSGATVLTQTFAQNKTADFVVVQNAWLDYPPALLPELGRNVINTDAAAATNAVNRVLGGR